MSEFSHLQLKARAFAEARDWGQFHSPKNLTMALGGEISELLDLFQWMTEDQSRNLSPDKKQAVAYEIADVQIYLLRLADEVGVDIPSVVEEKMAMNEARYPVDKAHGSTQKYTAYEGSNGDRE